ncbi:MAG: copper homeostasis protein CutC [Acidobacteria bacterium]|nr:copper homeostasis protein CutC [Acidobacteriota bacterium]
MIALEICVDSVASAIAAESGGAQRIELCSGLTEGGLTPSLGLLRMVRSQLNIAVHVMIRPRSGDFIYNQEDFAIMQEDVALAAQSSANGVVFGLLTPSGEVDISRTRALVELSRPMEVTFHRAFDLTRNPLAALEAIIHSGVDRVLTSGAESTAEMGQARIRQLILAAGDRIRIMVGGGVRAENASRLLLATGASEWHTSLRRKMTLEHAGGAPGAATLAEQLGGGDRFQPVRSEDVRKLQDVLKSGAIRS